MVHFTRLASMGRRLVMVLFMAWVGALWAVGFVVVPRLFAALPHAEAGRLAAGLFALVHGTALLVLPLVPWLARGWLERCLVGLCWLEAALSYWYLGPRIVNLALRGEHGLALEHLHAMATMAYGLGAVAAVVLAWRLTAQYARGDRTAANGACP